MKRDTCGWCGKGVNNVQSRGDTYLCPTCCPSIDNPEEVPEYAPTSWHNMSEDERLDWRNGMSMEDIMDKYEWYKPPNPRKT